MSYTRLLYHIVFRTKKSKNTIPEEHEKELYAYIMGIIKNKKSKLYRIGGISNHIHLLVDIHLKEKQTIIDYIKNQKEHHKKVSFEEEYRQFLIENGIDIDERYFLKE